MNFVETTAAVSLAGTVLCLIVGVVMVTRILGIVRVQYPDLYESIGRPGFLTIFMTPQGNGFRSMLESIRAGEIGDTGLIRGARTLRIVQRTYTVLFFLLVFLFFMGILSRDPST